MIAFMEFIKFMAWIALLILGIVLVIKAIRTKEQNGKPMNPIVRRFCIVLGLGLCCGAIWPSWENFLVFNAKFVKWRTEERAASLQRKYSRAITLLDSSQEALGRRNFQKALDKADQAIKLGEGLVLQEGRNGPSEFPAGEAHAAAGLAFFYLGKDQEAFACLKQGHEVGHRGPNSLATLALAWFLATCPDARYRNGKRAAILAEVVQNNRASCWRTDIVRAAAYAEMGEYEKAADFANPEFIYFMPKFAESQVKRHRKLYQSGKPYRLERDCLLFLVPRENLPNEDSIENDQPQAI